MNVVRRFWNFFKILIISASVLALCACELMGPKKQDETALPEPEAIEEPIPLPTDSLPPNKRVHKALNQLQHGDYENARNQLNWALLDAPNHSKAKKLLEQMDADPIEYLGIKNFFYDVQPGDSLSWIAKTFLNDPYKFVILARYNKLDNPSKLAPGQRIRVPGVMPERIKKPKVKATKKPKPILEAATRQQDLDNSNPTENTTNSLHNGIQETTPSSSPSEIEAGIPAEPEAIPEEALPSSEEIINSARKLHSEQGLPAAIYLLENNNQQPGINEIQILLASYYTEYANQLITDNDLERARTTLEKLIILDTSDNNAINQLIIVEDKIEVKKLFQKAKSAENDGSIEDAYHIYGEVLTYDPNNQAARESQLKVREQLTDNYHRQAMRLFRKQELEEAIAYWDKILKLDPNHSLAPGYKARALEMKQRLQRIDSGTK